MHQRNVAGRRWDPDRYTQFSDHRLRPAIELLDRVPLAAPKLIYDLGCGTGNVTQIIAQRWPDATVIGIDNSPEMLASAKARSSSITWVDADIADWRPDGAPDLIYSNATLHWLAGHEALFPRLFGLVAPGGCLAVQMPQSWPLRSHQLMREALAHGGAEGSPIGPAAVRAALDHVWVQDAPYYFDLLTPVAQQIDIWETEYLQILEGDDPALEWVSSTGLRPVLNGLSDDERATFLASYCAQLRAAYPVRANGQTLYPFRRLFIVATRDDA